MSDLSCLDNIIGLSRNECTCYDAGKPIDWNVSKSGLFLDEIEGLELKIIKGDVECGENNIWDKMERARENAKLAFRTDLLAEISKVTNSRRKTFNGTIGQVKYTKNRILGKVYNGLVIQNCNIQGGEFTIKGIKTLMDSSVSFTIEIWNNIQDTPLVTIPGINAIAGTVTDNPFAPDPMLTFPLWTDECDDLEYYIVYNPVGFNPKDNKLSCGCSRKNEWEHWAYLQGISGDDITEREYFLRDNYANGLLLDIQFNCNTSEIICGGKDGYVDYENDSNAMLMAYAMRFKAAELLIEDILASGNINRYTMLQKERLWGKRNHYVKEYDGTIAYLSTQIDLFSNDCLKCGDPRITKTSILA